MRIYLSKYKRLILALYVLAWLVCLWPAEKVMPLTNPPLAASFPIIKSILKPKPVKDTWLRLMAIEARKLRPKPKPIEVPKPPPKPVKRPVKALDAPISGDKHTWLRASGIPESAWPAVDFIISKESGWRPEATNRYSGAHGLPQALPYSKTGCGRLDAVCQLKWADSYAKTRYGGWWQAKAYWVLNHYW